MTMTAILVAASLAACRRSEYRSSREAADPQIVALGVRTDPPGAKVRVNKIERVWTTPCDIADFSLGRGTLEVEVSLAGYEPVKTRVSYDGYDPAWLKLRLVPLQTAARPPEAAPVAAPVQAPPPVREPAAAPPPAKAPEDKPAAKPAPVKIESVAGGTRLKVVSQNTKLRIQAKTVVSDTEKPGEFFLPDVPPEKVTVEFLDPKTDAVLGSVEFAPSAAPVAVVPPPAPKDPPVLEADRVGEVKLVSKTYGVYVKLDPGLSLQPGEEILVFRDGKEVARTKILKITKADSAYPDGAAEVKKDGSIQKGDEVRRSKP
jgi:hypothetical protein